MTPPAYHRVLLKLSGEALMGDGEASIAPEILQRIAGEISDLVEAGVQVALVIGAGNFVRGAEMAAIDIDRIQGDYMGMLATVINALAMQDAIKRSGQQAHVMSALPIQAVCENYDRTRAIAYLTQGHVVLFAAGTGNPLFTTDSAASLRAVEVNADLMIKATKVNGVYSADPVKDPTAQHFPRLSYDEVIQRRLAVMDTTAVVLCRDNHMPLRVLNLHSPGALMHAVMGEDVGTLVSA